MSTGEPIYLECRPKANSHRSTSSLLHDDSFIMALSTEIEVKVCEKFSHISTDWMRHTLGSRLAARTMVKIFLEEVGHGHIFCDDLFASTFKKYIGSDIPFYCSQEIPCLICYDFCMFYMPYFNKLIENIHHIDTTIKDDLTRTALFKGFPIYMLFEQALKQQHGSVICCLNRKGELPYLHLENNLDEVLARVEEREKAKKPAKLPYSFEDPTKDRILLDVARDIEIFNSIRICVSGKESPCRTKNNF